LVKRRGSGNRGPKKGSEPHHWGDREREKAAEDFLFNSRDSNLREEARGSDKGYKTQALLLWQLGNRPEEGRAANQPEQSQKIQIALPNEEEGKNPKGKIPITP